MAIRRLLGNNLSGLPAPSLPPGDRSFLVWAFDPAVGGGGQTHNSRIGPTGTLGSTSGADTNDPAFVGSPPARYTFDVDNYLDFADNLDATLQASFTMQIAVEFSAGDVAATRGTFDKGLAIEITAASGAPRIVAYHAGAGADFDRFTANAALTAGKHVITFKRNTAAGRGSRHFIYVAGNAVAGTHVAGGIDGSVANTANGAHVGFHTGFTVVPCSAISSVYLWNALLGDASILANATYTRVTRRWQ